MLCVACEIYIITNIRIHNSMTIAILITYLYDDDMMMTIMMMMMVMRMMMTMMNIVGF